MRDPANNRIKAWAKEYEESPFFFEQDSPNGKRLVAWSENSTQIEPAFYAIVELFPSTVEVLLKISTPDLPDSKKGWSRFHATVDNVLLRRVVRENEDYVFANGMHQLCVKDPNGPRYMAFDEHGIFFIYSPTSADIDVFVKHSFERRYAEPIYRMGHFKQVSHDSETAEAKFVKDLELKVANSDLD